MAAVVQTAASGTEQPHLFAEAKTRKVELEELSRELARWKVADAQLRRDPADPAANTVAGRYLCFFKGDWKAGLPLLAKGSDPALKALAAAELKPPSPADPAGREKRWRAVAEGQPPTAKKHILALLGHALPEGSPTLTATTDKEGRRVVDLMPLIDVARDVYAGGGWVKLKEGLASTDSAPSRLLTAYVPPEEYDLQVSFTQRDATGWLSLMASHGQHPFEWVLGSGDPPVSAFGNVGGADIWHNPTTRKGTNLLRTGERQTCVVEVRRNHIAADVDGKRIARHKTDGSDLSFSGFGEAGRGRLGVLVHGGRTVFHSIKVVEVTGQGTVVPRKRTANVLRNGNFEKVDRAGNPSGWKNVRDGAPKFPAGKGGRFLRITKGQSVHNGEVDLDPRWVSVTVAVRVRQSGVQLISPNWWDWPLINACFTNGVTADEFEERMMSFRGDTDWTDAAFTFDIPPTAKKLILGPRNFTSGGTLDLDDIRVFPRTINDGEFAGASWIWFPEGEPGVVAPAGVRHFRRVVDLPDDAEVDEARLRITADDGYVLYVNGERASEGSAGYEAWRHPKEIDLAPLLRPGRNVLAVAATNGLEDPAGLLVAATIAVEGGEPQVIVSDRSWRSLDKERDGWGKPGFDDAAWPAAKEGATFGRWPWGTKLEPAKP